MEYDESLAMSLPPDIRGALDQFIAEEFPGIARSDAVLIVLREWAIAHGYLQPPPEQEDAN